MLRKIVLFTFFTLLRIQLFAQPVSVPDTLLYREWSARWIAHPIASLTDYGVYHFRHAFTLPTAPDSFVVHVSADNRYRLFVNGTPVGFGPARGDLLHWRYESYNIADLLTPGENTLAAVVWNFGEHRPVAQHSYRTGFILQGNPEQHPTVDTDPDTWRVLHNEAYRPLTQQDFTVKGYYATGATDHLRGDQYPWGWGTTAFQEGGAWQTPRDLGTGKPYGMVYGYGDGTHNLLPRAIPMMEEHPERFKRVARSEGMTVDSGFVSGDQPVTVPANTTATLLLDQNYLVAGYPELRVSGGRGSRIKITYAEALYNEQGYKGNRNETAGKHMLGYFDIFEPDGGADRVFQPLWTRTYRYVELDIETGNDPLTLHDFFGTYSNYPFEETAFFESNDTTTGTIWDVGWRTARLCATETYMDCPYYEQLQYVGDTRIQALISLYVSGDDRLVRNALRQFDHSRAPEGITMSRYPSSQPQYIPPYSLFWVAMVHDYHQHRSDTAFVKQFLPGIQAVLQWFEARQDDNGILTDLQWWNYVDVAEGFPRGVPPGAEGGHSTLITLQWVYALDYAAELFEYYGQTDQARHYRNLSAATKQAVLKTSYDAGRQLLADDPEKTSFSQHANIMAILTDAVPEAQQAAILEKLLNDSSLVQCNIYYRFYLTRAVQKLGQADYFVNHLDTWKDMLAQGLTTFAEHEDQTRSDCHAWSASPNYEFLATVCGIRPAAPHFAAVKIAPALGYLKTVSGSMPHPQGEIAVKFTRQGKDGLVGEVTLPPGLTGELSWQEESVKLTGGKQEVKF